MEKTSNLTINPSKFAKTDPWWIIEGQCYHRPSYTHICVRLIFFIFPNGDGGGAVRQRGNQELWHRQIWANEDIFLCSSPISVRRTSVIFIFLKLRKLGSMFLVVARISPDFGLNSKKSGYISKKRQKICMSWAKKRALRWPDVCTRFLTTLGQTNSRSTFSDFSP